MDTDQTNKTRYWGSSREWTQVDTDLALSGVMVCVCVKEKVKEKDLGD